jgi:hypothetical protein
VSDELGIQRGPVYRVNRGMDPLTRRLMWIAGGLASALLVIFLAWSFVGHRGGPVPVVQADQRPVRVKPANPGGMQIPGLSAESGSDDTASADKLAPAPETPDPQGLARQKPLPAPASPAAPSSTASLTQTGTQAVAPLVTGASGRPIAAGAAAATPLSGAASSAAPTTTKPAQVAAVPMQERRPSPASRTQVQLAAVGTKAAAQQEWDRLSHQMPGVLGTHRPMFSKTERDGRTLWRVRTGEFPTESEASQFCQQVRAKGGGCAVAAF